MVRLGCEIKSLSAVSVIVPVSATATAYRNCCKVILFTRFLMKLTRRYLTNVRLLRPNLLSKCSVIIRTVGVAVKMLLMPWRAKAFEGKKSRDAIACRGTTNTGISSSIDRKYMTTPCLLPHRTYGQSGLYNLLHSEGTLTC